MAMSGGDDELRRLERLYKETEDHDIKRMINVLRKRMGLDAFSKSNIPNPKDWGGYIRHYIARCGCLIVLVRARQADIDPEEGRFAIICDEHSTLNQGFFIEDLEEDGPEVWCEGCRKEAEDE